MSHQIREAIKLTCRIIVKQKLDSGPFGNISIREPNTDTFWVNCSGVTFEHITEKDIVRMDLHGNVLDGELDPHPGEFIHREIYRRRPDIQAIVHTHSENTVALSLLGCKIEPFTQLGAAFYEDQGIYHGFTGPVRTSDEGAEIAKALGQNSLLVAKNHGVFATGSSIQAALWDMIIADAAAKIHLTARQHGIHAAEKISDEFMQKSKIEVRHKQNEFMWESFVKSL